MNFVTTMTRITAELDHIKANQKEFIEKLGKAGSFAYVLAWSETTFDEAAMESVLHEIINGLTFFRDCSTERWLEATKDDGEVSTDRYGSFKLWLQRKALEKIASKTGRSTMATSNLIERAEAAAWAKIARNIDSALGW